MATDNIFQNMGDPPPPIHISEDDKAVIFQFLDPCEKQPIRHMTPKWYFI